MKSRIIWGAVLLAAFVAFYYVTIRPTIRPARVPSGRMPLVRDKPTFTLPKEFETATLPVPKIPVPPIRAIRVDPPALKPPEIPIQNGATIDFSLGTGMIRSSSEDEAALNKALKEMADATKNIEFPPTKADPNAKPSP